MISWRLDRFGNIEVWDGRLPYDDGRKADHYITGDVDVNAFLNTQGLDKDHVEPGDTGECADPGFFH
jgi:hypothetical protein